MAGACRRAGNRGQTRTAELVSVTRMGETIIVCFSSLCAAWLVQLWHAHAQRLSQKLLVADITPRVYSVGTACADGPMHTGVRSHGTVGMVTLVLCRPHIGALGIHAKLVCAGGT